MAFTWVDPEPNLAVWWPLVLSESEIRTELASFDGRLNIAAVNSPSSVTVSGDADAITQLESKLSDHGIFARQLRVKQAFHSHHMLPLAPPYKAALEACKHFKTRNGTCRMFSSVTSQAADFRRMGAPYWAENMVQPVRFADALTGILLDEDENQLVDVLVEIGPHPALKGPGRQVLSFLTMNLPYVATLQRGQPAYESLLETAGSLFALGFKVDLKVVNQDEHLANNQVRHASHAKRLYDMPSYSWNHKSYWGATRLTRQQQHRKFRHTLLGSILPGSTRKGSGLEELHSSQ